MYEIGHRIATYTVRTTFDYGISPTFRAISVGDDKTQIAIFPIGEGENPYAEVHAQLLCDVLNRQLLRKPEPPSASDLKDHGAINSFCDGALPMHATAADSAKPAGEPSIPTNARISAIAARHFTNWPKFPDEVFSFARELIESLASAPAPSPEPVLTDEQCADIISAVRSVFGGISASSDKAKWASMNLKARNLIRAATNPEPAGTPVFESIRDAASAVYEATVHAQASGTCPDCHGSGEGVGMEGRGPDTYEVPIICPKCNGSGEVPAEPASAPSGKPPMVLFEGWEVYNRLTPKARKRTTAENVSDTLDAVVKLMRERADTPLSAAEMRKTINTIEIVSTQSTDRNFSLGAGGSSHFGSLKTVASGGVGGGNSSKEPK